MPVASGVGVNVGTDVGEGGGVALGGAGVSLGAIVAVIVGGKGVGLAVSVGFTSAASAVIVGVGVGSSWLHAPNSSSNKSAMLTESQRAVVTFRIIRLMCKVTPSKQSPAAPLDRRGLLIVTLVLVWQLWTACPFSRRAVRPGLTSNDYGLWYSVASIDFRLFIAELVKPFYKSG